MISNREIALDMAAEEAEDLEYELLITPPSISLASSIPEGIIVQQG